MLRIQLSIFLLESIAQQTGKPMMFENTKTTKGWGLPNLGWWMIWELEEKDILVLPNSQHSQSVDLVDGEYSGIHCS